MLMLLLALCWTRWPRLQPPRLLLLLRPPQPKPKPSQPHQAHPLTLTGKG
jgi:hypothetical protein